jgi:hypothetical protein
MDRKTFMVWLRKRGFKRKTFDVYEAPYEGAMVRVEVGWTSGKTTLYGERVLVHKYNLADLGTDESHMVQGAGLTEYFAERVLFGERFPKWFTKEYRKSTTGRINREPRLTEARAWKDIDDDSVPERGGSIIGKQQVSSWLVDNGFRQVGFDAFEAEYEDDLVRVFLSEFGVQTSRITSSAKEILSNTQYRSLKVDKTGMLRKASLVTPFMDDVFDGAEMPAWFTPGFIYAHAAGLKAAGVNLAGHSEWESLRQSRAEGMCPMLSRYITPLGTFDVFRYRGALNVFSNVGKFTNKGYSVAVPGVALIKAGTEKAAAAMVEYYLGVHPDERQWALSEKEYKEHIAILEQNLKAEETLYPRSEWEKADLACHKETHEEVDEDDRVALYHGLRNEYPNPQSAQKPGAGIAP